VGAVSVSREVPPGTDEKHTRIQILNATNTTVALCRTVADLLDKARPGVAPI
jgi:hypothetical protein